MPPKKKKDVIPVVELPPPDAESATPAESSAPTPRMISMVTGEPFGPRVRRVGEQAEEESSDDEPESESDDESRFLKDELNSEVPAEFWHMQKLIKYMKAGNQTATTVALCLLKDYELSSRVIQRVIHEMGGLEVLVNLLETREIKCQHGSLAVLLQISSSPEMRRHLIDLGIITPLIELLKHPARDIQVLTVETMANIALMRKARKQIRIRGGVPLILDIMDVPDSVVQRPAEDLDENEKELLAVAIGCAKVLNSLSSSPKIKEELRKHGAVFLIARFLKSRTTELIVPMMGAVQQCADLKVFRLAFERMEIIIDIVRHLENEGPLKLKEKESKDSKLKEKENEDAKLKEKENEDAKLKEKENEDSKLKEKESEDAKLKEKESVKLKENCALAIYKCAVNKVTRDMVREAGGLDPLCKLVQDKGVYANKKLLAAVTGAIWKCAISPENVNRFNQNNLVAALVPLLGENEDKDVLANVVGALAECCKNPTNREVLRASEGLPKLIKLLSATHEPLLENIPLVIGECAQNEQCMDEINDQEHQLDGVRLVWSLLKHPSDSVKRNACFALVPCIRHAKNSPEMVRAFVGGLELVVSLLESEDTEVLGAVCATIAEIATDPENLGILTDHGVVKKLADLVHTEDEKLRANLTLAIAFCCEWGQNNYEFGRLNAVAPLVNYLTSTNKEVLKGVCIAFFHLSKEPSNCVTMHTCGVVKHVLRLVGSEDSEVQIAAATTIRHIRKLALTAEKFHYKEMYSIMLTLQVIL